MCAPKTQSIHKQYNASIATTKQMKKKENKKCIVDLLVIRMHGDHSRKDWFDLIIELSCYNIIILIPVLGKYNGV